ncbi:hypothetical protein SAMN02745702_01011 [Desulfobaculum bizertense DSM 18034]|uniref:Uncharacterized protein n=1 Tax=Desulfobaculum bizertense DSM 18034 TaxID=1121442 RepID=A0A1T4VUI6_9BACT|nr:hypothetical protein SAMN02745702_01011 [Desulfobaculum bizertense DSM 18034]
MHWLKQLFRKPSRRERLPYHWFISYVSEKGPGTAFVHTENPMRTEEDINIMNFRLRKDLGNDIQIFGWKSLKG